MTAPRCVCPEALDDLAPGDPKALRSRRDLRRVHRAMRSVSALNHALSRLRLAAHPKSILELGAGDGSLLLRLAAAVRPRWPGVKLTLLDRQHIVSSETVESYRRHGWEVTTVCEDALIWARQSAHQHYDLTVATLFLHHFRGSRIAGAASRRGLAKSRIHCDRTPTRNARKGGQSLDRPPRNERGHPGRRGQKRRCGLYRTMRLRPRGRRPIRRGGRRNFACCRFRTASLRRKTMCG